MSDPNKIPESEKTVVQQAVSVVKSATISGMSLATVVSTVIVTNVVGTSASLDVLTEWLACSLVDGSTCPFADARMMALKSIIAAVITGALIGVLSYLKDRRKENGA